MFCAVLILTPGERGFFFLLLLGGNKGPGEGISVWDNMITRKEPVWPTSLSWILIVTNEVTASAGLTSMEC